MTRREKFLMAGLITLVVSSLLFVVEWLHEIGVIPPHRHLKEHEDMDLDI